jgi:hypothetical protein
LCVPGRAHLAASPVSLQQCRVATTTFHPPLGAAHARRRPLLKPHPSLVAYKGLATPSAQIFPRRSTIGTDVLQLHGVTDELPPPLPFLQIWLRLPVPDLTSWPSRAGSTQPDHRRALAPPTSQSPATSGEPRAPLHGKMEP